MAGAVVALGSKGWVETQIRAALTAQGLADASFTVESFGPSGITFKDVNLGEKIPLRFDRMTIGYSIKDLLKKQVHALKIDQMQVKQGQVEITVSDTVFKFEPSPAPDSWQGTWTAKKIEIANAPLPLPDLMGAGSFLIADSRPSLKGEFKSDDASHHAMIDVNPSQVTVVEASFPWNGGRLAAHNAVLPLDGKPMYLTLEVQSVPMDAIMRLLTSDRAKASGAVSGKVPISREKDGTLVFRSGSLKAEGSGTLILAPDAIPGDNQQVGIVRDVLSNFHYEQFTILLDSGQDKKLSILLQLSGNNPDAYNGRPVKLNVNLTGDVLSMVQQSIVPMTDPKQLLKQDDHAK